MYDWTVVWSVVFLVSAIYYWLNYQNYFERHSIIHKKPLPFVGNNIPMLIRTKSFAEYIQSIYDLSDQAKYVGFYDFTKPVIMIRDPELIKDMIVKNSDHFRDHRPILQPDREPLIANNLFGLCGNKWRETRNILSPAFTSSKMKSMFQLMSNCGKNFADYLAENVENESTINAKDAFTKYTTDVIGTCAFGVVIDSMRDPTNDFYLMGKKATRFDGIATLLKFLMTKVSPTLTSWFDIKITDRKAEAFFYDLVKNIVEMRDREGVTRPDMIQLMMENRNNKIGDEGILTIHDMVCQAFIFFFGGFESTSLGMCFVTHLIAAHPEVQKKLQNEVDEVYEKYGEVNYDAINNLKYMKAVINEAMRLYPLQAIVDRVCTKSFVLPPALPGDKPLVLKPNDNVVVPVYPLHRDPNYFPNPDEFCPERFIDNPNMTLHSPAYLPFGGGPRMCLGYRFALLELKVLLFHLIVKYTLKPGKDMILPLELSKSNMVMTAKGGFFLTLEPRNKCNQKGNGTRL